MAETGKPGMDKFREILRSVASQPDNQATCLPGIFYTDPDFFRLEVDTFLSREWHCLGRTDEIPTPGDYFTAQLFSEPLLVVRNDRDEISVMSNVCRHRGMQLASGSGSARAFICPYHAWRYDRQGRLLNAPHFDLEEKGLHDCTLPTFASETWNGFIYVNLDPEAAPLSTRLGQLQDLLAPYRTQDMRIVATFEEDWNTNWKCLIENFSESYHLSMVHPETLRPYTPTNLSRKLQGDPAYTAYAANYPETADPRGAGSPDLSVEERNRSTLFCLFPTHLASQAATLLVSFSVKPLAVDRINVRWTLSTFGDELTDTQLEERIALWHEVNREDREKLEKMQVSLGSRHAPTGPLAMPDYEATIFDFYKYLDGKIT